MKISQKKIILFMTWICMVILSGVVLLSGVNVKGASEEEDQTTVSAVPILKSFTSSKKYVICGDEITFSAEVYTNSDMLYRFDVKDVATNTWSTISEYSKENVIKYTFMNEGTYVVRALVKKENSTSVKQYDDYMDIVIKCSKGLQSFKANKATGQRVGTTVKFTAIPYSYDNMLFEFAVKYNGKWTTVQPYSSNNVLSFTGDKLGTYLVRVYFKNSTEYNGTADGYKDITFKFDKEANPNPVNLVKFKANKATGQLKGTEILFTAQSDNSEDAVYKFAIKYNGKWTTVQDYSKENTFNFIGNEAGTYLVRVYAKNVNDWGQYDSYKDITMTILDL